MRLAKYLTEDDTTTIRQRKRVRKMIKDIDERIREISSRQVGKDKTDADENQKKVLRQRKETLRKELERYE